MSRAASAPDLVEDVGAARRCRRRAWRSRTGSPPLSRLTSWMIAHSSSSGSWPSACMAAFMRGDVAVVVGAPDVDQQVEAPGELVAVVGDVGEQVGELAVALDQHPVLVVAEVGGAQPHRAVLRRRPRRARAGRRGSSSMAPDSTIDRSLNHVSKWTFMRPRVSRWSSTARGLAPLPSGVDATRRGSRPPSRRRTGRGSRPRARRRRAGGPPATRTNFCICTPRSLR